MKHSVQILLDDDLEEMASVSSQDGQELQTLPSSDIQNEQLATRNSASTDCDSDVISASPMDTTSNETLDRENGIQNGTACTLGNGTAATAAQKDNDCVLDTSAVAQIVSSADGADALDKQNNLQQPSISNDAMKTNGSETEYSTFASPEEQPQHVVYVPEDNAKVELDAASKLQKVNDDLQDKNARLKEKNGGLIEAVGNVKKYKENFGLQETVVELQKDFAGFRKENLEQREKSFVAEREAWKEVDSLRKELRDLNKENIATSKEVIGLKEEIFQLKVTTGDLQGSIEVLQEGEEEGRGEEERRGADMIMVDI
ncbi:hypothetical protein QFC22_002718 [Naganishia vaughanmartiniae]|uniref:Uncharacterized protein n=1 Tax=Naganishia vaughanmartiniae TaxID=1424756 RepID=A0ACC2XB24_9TREE|nr:hypothetical protein QFC22_002718 [Naganishia vaughanmartiniae]